VDKSVFSGISSWRKKVEEWKMQLKYTFLYTINYFPSKAQEMKILWLKVRL